MPTKIPQILSYVRGCVLGITPYTARDVAPDRNVVRLNRNESPFGPSPEVIEALRAHLRTPHRYPTAPLVRRLREKIADYVGLDEGNVVICGGSDSAIDAAVRVFVDPGDAAVISVPTFPMYEFFTRIAGGTAEFVRKREDFGWDVGGILDLIRSRRAKIAFVCSPNNPTGKTMEEGDLRSIADESVVVVLDEAYAEFVDRPLTGLVKEYENLIAIRTFSKAFGLAGLRIGYALSHPSLAEMMERVIPPFPVNVMALVAASAALDDLEYVGKIRGLIAAGREYLRDGLSGIDGVTVYPSQTNFLLVKVDGAGSDGIARALARRGILVRDCSDERGLGPNFIRVTVGTMDENRRLVRAMREAMSEAIG